jgi:hypothetical protein
MSKHTPEPWALSSESARIIVEPPAFEGAGSRRFIGSTCGHPNSWIYPTEESGEANALRIVSCVNACAGMEDPGKEIQCMRRQLHAVLSGLEQTLPDLIEIMLSGDVGELLNDPVGHLQRVYGAVLEYRV